MRAVTTALRVLEQVAAHQPVGVSELSRLMNLPKSNVQRALVALHDVGWVEQEPGGTRRWVQTTKLLALASRGGGLTLRERAMPVMRELSERTDENVHLAVLTGQGVAIIDKLDSSRSVRLFDPLGVVAPIHASSTGKAILAFTEPDIVERLLEGELDRYTNRTVVTGQALRRELRAIRRNGYSVNRGEWRDDVRGVAAPILDSAGKPQAAISIAMPASRLPDRQIPAMGELVRETVSKLSLSHWDDWNGQPR